MNFYLDEIAENHGFGVSEFITIDSTNSEALRQAKNNHLSNHWFVAKNQTAGRGRLARIWQWHQGNLAASLLLRLNVAPDKLSTIAFVAALAIYRALLEAGTNAKISLKWPNDILANGEKICGILLEAHQTQSGDQALVIGFGVNIVAAPKDLPYGATCLQDIGSDMNAEQLFKLLSKHWLEVYRIWNEGEGLSEILKQWKKAASSIGDPVAISNHGKVIEGVFEDVDNNGRLIVKTPSGQLEYISSGDVHFGTAASIKEL